MTRENIIDAIATEESGTQIHRPFAQNENARIITTLLNALLVEDKSEAMHATVLALSMHPTNRWCIEANERIEIAIQSRAACPEAIDKPSKELESILMTYPQLNLADRQKCIKATKSIVALVENDVNLLMRLSDRGAAYATLLIQCNLEDKSYLSSRYRILQGYKDAVRILCGRIGDNLARLFQDVDFYGQADVEWMVLYHNTDVLLEKYHDFISERTCFSDSPSKIIRAIQSGIDVVSLGYSDRKYEEAERITQFLKLTYFAINEIKTFPNEGNILYQYLMLKYGQTKKTHLVREEMGKTLGVHYNTIPRIREKAITALSICLWGCVTKEFLYDFNAA